MTHFVPGTVLAVQIGLFEHVGIATECNTVISNSQKRGCVTEESVSEFASGKRIQDKGYPGDLCSNEVISHARQLIGQPWNLFQNNCEHFVYWAHGLRSKSPQLQIWLILIVEISAILLMRKK